MDRLAPHVENAREKAAPMLADAKVKTTACRLFVDHCIGLQLEGTDAWVATGYGVQLFDRDDASTLLFLPLAHVFARIIQVGAVKARVRLGHSADIVGLLFLKQAPEGGESTVVSALSVYNLLAKTQPELLQHLMA